MSETSSFVLYRVFARIAPLLAAASGDPKFTLVGDRGSRVVVPFAPLPLDITGLAASWQTLNRAQLAPLLLYAGGPQPVMAFTLTVANRDLQDPVEGVLDALRAAAASTERFSVSYGPQERGLWHITDLHLTVTARQARTNLATQATAAMTLTQASDVTGVGPVSGGVGPKPPPGAKSPAPAPSTAQHTYRVVAGDTLWAIAIRFYRDPNQWTRIADANGIRDPRLLRIGTLLRLP